MKAATHHQTINDGHQRRRHGSTGTIEGRRRRRLGRSLRTTAVAVTVVLSMTVAAAFQSSSFVYSERGQRRSYHVGGRRQVVSDPNTMLLRRAPLPTTKKAPPNAELEKMYQMSTGEASQFSELDWIEMENKKDDKTGAATTTKKKRLQFRGLVTTARKRKRRIQHTNNKNLPPLAAADGAAVAVATTNRSSTMPGFSAESDQQRAHRAGIRIAEKRSGRKIKDTAERKNSRKQHYGEAMYLNSASVPDSMVQFAAEIHRQDRITRQEEVELGEKTQEAVRLQNQYELLRSSLKREPTDDEWCAAAGKINMEALRQAIEEGIEAKNKLVTSNLRMVQSVVNTYIRNGLSGKYNAGDMMQEGMIALIRAAEKFEPDRGWKFSTYAMYWVRSSVKRSQIGQSRIVTVPQRLHENHKRLLKVESDLTVSLGRKPSKTEMGHVIGMSEMQVDRCMRAMQQRCYSLDQEISNPKKPMQRGGGSGGQRDTLIDLLDSHSDDGEHRKLELGLLREDFVETLHRHLDQQAVQIVMLRFGFMNENMIDNIAIEQQQQLPAVVRSSDRQLTIAEVARIVNAKPDRVRRILKKSLEKLKSVGDGEEWHSFQRQLP